MRGGGVGIHYDDSGIATLKETDHTARFGRYKTTIWLKSFVGRSPDEIITNGENRVRALGEFYSDKFNINLGFMKIYEDIEWVKLSKEASKAQAKREGIRKGTRLEIAGAYHTYEDFEGSHPDHVEYDAVPGKDKTTPTEHARIDHYIYSGKLGSDLEKITEAIDAQSKLSVSDRALLHEVVEGFVALRQRFEIENKR